MMKRLFKSAASCRTVSLTRALKLVSEALSHPLYSLPQWVAANAEIKVPSVENTELKGSPFKA